jgi:hypothetical protein
MQDLPVSVEPELPDSMDREAFRGRCRAWAPRAFEVVVDLMQHGEHERIRLEAARLILEFSGYKPGERHEVTVVRDFGGTVAQAWKLREARLRSSGGNGNCEALPVAPRVLPAPDSPGARNS